MRNALGYRLSLVFVTRQRIQALNKRYLKRTYATDVLSFDLSARGSRSKEIKGEVIISTQAAVANSRVYGTSIAKEIDLYVVHGILHLLGFDDHSPAEIKRMRAAENEVLKGLGYDR